MPVSPAGAVPQCARGQGESDGPDGVGHGGRGAAVAALVTGVHGEGRVRRQPPAEAGAEQGRSLLADGSGGLAAAYLLGTLAACLVAVTLAGQLSSRAAQRDFAAEEGNE